MGVKAYIFNTARGKGENHQRHFEQTWVTTFSLEARTPRVGDTYNTKISLSSVWVLRHLNGRFLIPLIISIHLLAGRPLQISPPALPIITVFSSELVLLRICPK